MIGLHIVRRVHEQKQLATCLESSRPEFIAVYGRRRVGKTYLIREYFNNRFAFYATGVAGGMMRDQLRFFHDSLREAGSDERKAPKDWFEAFSRLRPVLERDGTAREPGSGKLVVFLDELPGMDTARSVFRAALDRFWNIWGSVQSDLLLIVCGSATSWMINNLIDNHGGFYNRITRQFSFAPFTLKECEEYFAIARTGYTRQQTIECYMTFGGIPYYLDLIDRKYSLAQNIDQLCFIQTGQLRYEFDRLYASLFKHSSPHVAIVRALAKRAGGVLRSELQKLDDIGGGQPLTKALRELEQWGFVRKYHSPAKAAYGCLYQLIDPFSLFLLRLLDHTHISPWLSYAGTQSYAAWRGYAFELVCLLHLDQVKCAIGISGVETYAYAWRSSTTKPAAQIDLVIDRRDDVINICEMKYVQGEFAIDASYAQALQNNSKRLHERSSHIKPCISP